MLIWDNPWTKSHHLQCHLKHFIKTFIPKIFSWKEEFLVQIHYAIKRWGRYRNSFLCFRPLHCFHCIIGSYITLLSPASSNVVLGSRISAPLHCVYQRLRQPNIAKSGKLFSFFGTSNITEKNLYLINCVTPVRVLESNPDQFFINWRYLHTLLCSHMNTPTYENENSKENRIYSLLTLNDKIDGCLHWSSSI